MSDYIVPMPDIANLAMVMSQMNVQSAVNTAVLSDALEVAQVDANALTNMIPIAQPGLGENIDISI